jgi:putative hydrolase of the HAD superfamily
MRGICAVFDIDDTLYLERDYVRSGFEAVGRWAAKRMSIKDFGERCWASFLAGRRGSIFDAVLREVGEEPTIELVSSVVQVYRMHIPSITLEGDAYAALTVLSSVASIAVISDGPQVSQRRKVEALGLSVFAAPVVLTDSLGEGFSKPHPRAFEYVSQIRPAGRYIYIADNPVKDFNAPRELGWTTIRVRRPGGLHYGVENSEITPDFEIPDCANLPDVIATL